MSDLNSKNIENEINKIRMNFVQLFQDLTNYQDETRKKQAGKKLFSDLVGTALKQGAGVPKKSTQNVTDYYKSNENIPREYFDRFGNQRRQLKELLSKVSQKTETGRENSSRLVTSINKILTPKQLHTQVNHAINFCDHLYNMNLVSNEELRQIRSDYRKSREEIKIKNSEPKVEILKQNGGRKWWEKLGVIASIITIIWFLLYLKNTYG